MDTLTIYRKDEYGWDMVNHYTGEIATESFADTMVARYIDKRPSITRTTYEFMHEDDSRIITFYFWNSTKYVYHIRRH